MLPKCQKLLDHAKKSAADSLKTVSEKAVLKIEDTTGDLIGNKTADKTTIVSRK